MFEYNKEAKESLRHFPPQYGRLMTKCGRNRIALDNINKWAVPLYAKATTKGYGKEKFGQFLNLGMYRYRTCSDSVHVYLKQTFNM